MARSVVVHRASLHQNEQDCCRTVATRSQSLSTSTSLLNQTVYETTTTRTTTKPSFPATRKTRRFNHSRVSVQLNLVAILIVVASVGDLVQSFPTGSSTLSSTTSNSIRRGREISAAVATTKSTRTTTRRNSENSITNLSRGGGSIDRKHQQLSSSQSSSSSSSSHQSSSSMSASTTSSSSSSSHDGGRHRPFSFSPRSASCLLMSLAMALHFGGYEFCRSGAMALLTSKVSPHGFGNVSAAYPFFMGLVTPVSLSLVYGYGRVLKASGPRNALKVSTGVSVGVLGVCSSFLMYMILSGFGVAVQGGAGGISFGSGSGNGNVTSMLLQKVAMAVLFIFQNSYAHLIYTQQWSFLGSVMTPTEGTKWFSLIAGLSSVVCTLTARMVPSLLAFFRRFHPDDSIGLLGLVFGTCTTLFMSLICADWAYKVAEQHGFDPKPAAKEQNKIIDVAEETEESLLQKTRRMFRTSKTLAGLFGEVISFQSLSTVLNVCFVQQLQQSIPNDTDRAGFTSQFYALVNGSSGMMQFFVLPLARKYLEPRLVYRFLPLLLMPLLVFSTVTITTNTSAKMSIPFLPSMDSALFLSALAFFALKSTDYSIRNVANELVYQPLTFDERYLGKEVNGVVANRVGKSGSSMVLSWVTFLFPGSWGRTAGAVGIRNLSQLSLVIGTTWSACSVWLSQHVISNKQAEEKVISRTTNQNRQSTSSNGRGGGNGTDDESSNTVGATKKVN